MNRDRSQNRELLLKLMSERILFLDGATGTTIQDYKLEEEDFRGDLLKDHPSPLKGNNEMLVLNRPDITKEIHLRFLRAGADIVETNTFNGTSFSQAEYGTEHLVQDINVKAAQIAREACDEMEKETPDRPRFVAGCLGPTGKTLSLSPRVEEPGFRDITFDQLEQAYFDAAMGLIEGGSDIIIIETIFDTLNAKAAIMAARRAFRESDLELPIMISGTITDASGRTLSGQTAEAFLYSIEHADPISVGFNCALGATEMKSHVEVLSKYASCGISTHPNAGLPDDMGNYLDTPEIMADILEDFAKEGLLNIVGGCCGTKPDHIAAITRRLSSYSPRVIPEKRHVSRYSGLEPLVITPDSLFINVGERNNVAGSRKFARLIREKKYEEALEIARVQVEDGANIVDVNLDDAMLESKEEMSHFLKLVASEPEISRVPLMIDSSKWEVLEAGLKCVQGKCIVNSISLKEGEQEFLEKAAKIKEYGAAAVVMAFDEQGQADTKERKIEISRRSYKLLLDKVGFNPEDIIFDVNVFAVATGMEEHRNYGVDFIEAIRVIKKELPYVRFSGGISNLSFSFRGNNVVREAMHTIFLYYGFQAGLDMGIVNAGQLGIYEDIPEKLRNTAEDVILNRRPEAEEELLEMAQEFIGQGKKEEKTLEWRNEIPKERLIYGLMKGIHAFVDEDVQALLDEGLTPLSIIEDTLMEGMNRIGDLFGAGKMFLPQVVKSARVMKKAVAILEPLMEEESGEAKSNGTIVMATVKGDVHDIGKNIVSVVLQCNSFDVIDLGVMTPCEDIIAAAKEHNADIIGLSGLITPSLEEMSHVASVMEKEKFNIPLMIGGATTSSVHTAVKIAPEYESGCVVQVPDASRVPGILSDLLSKDRRETFIANLKREQQEIREKREKSRSELKLTSFRDALAEKPEFNWKSYKPYKPNKMGPHVFTDIPIEELLPLFEWPFYLLSCGMKGKYPDILTDPDKGVEAQKLIDDAHTYLKEKGHHFSVRAMCAFYPAINRNDVLHFMDEKGNTLEEFPMVRQQNRHGKTGKFHSLADYVMPEGSADGRTDYAGVFSATCMDSGNWEDPYDAMIMEALSYRLVEASAEWMENRVADELWGYKAAGYEGIRPGPGYPACPDHTDKERIFRIMDVPGNIGTKMTESYMMDPPASVCGYYFAHPEAKYFAVMGITRDQLEDYAAKKNQPVKEVERWLAVDIIDK